MDKSICRFNDIINNEINEIKSNFKITLLIYGKRISQLVYSKLNNMEKILDYIKDQKKMQGEFSRNSQLNDSDLDLLDLENVDEYKQRDEEEETHFKFLQKELAAIDQETLKSRLELEKWKQEAKIFENMMRRPNANSEMLSDIVSDIASKKDESVFIFFIKKNFI